MTDQESMRIPRLETLLKALNIKQKEFSKKTKINYEYVSHLRSGYRPITLSTIYKIKEAYPNLNENWLKDGEGDIFITEKVDGVEEPGLKYLPEPKATDPLSELRSLLEDYGKRIVDLEETLRRLQKRED